MVVHNEHGKKKNISKFLQWPSMQRTSLTGQRQFNTFEHLFSSSEVHEKRWKSFSTHRAQRLKYHPKIIIFYEKLFCYEYKTANIVFFFFQFFFTDGPFLLLTGQFPVGKVKHFQLRKPPIQKRCFENTKRGFESPTNPRG